MRTTAGSFALVGHQEDRLGRRRCDGVGEAGMRHSERNEPGHLHRPGATCWGVCNRCVITAIRCGDDRQPIGRRNRLIEAHHHLDGDNAAGAERMLHHGFAFARHALPHPLFDPSANSRHPFGITGRRLVEGHSGVPQWPVQNTDVHPCAAAWRSSGSQLGENAILHPLSLDRLLIGRPHPHLP